MVNARTRYRPAYAMLRPLHGLTKNNNKFIIFLYNK